MSVRLVLHRYMKARLAASTRMPFTSVWCGKLPRRRSRTCSGAIRLDPADPTSPHADKAGRIRRCNAEALRGFSGSRYEVWLRGTHCQPQSVSQNVELAEDSAGLEACEQRSMCVWGCKDLEVRCRFLDKVTGAGYSARGMHNRAHV